MEKEIGKIIKEKRRSMGLSLEGVARQIGLSYRTILFMEQGNNCTISTLLSVCEVLGLQVSITEKEITNE